MEISQIKTFYEIVKSGSFSNASKSLFITQSAVSHQIKNWEKELGIKLFERMGNRMVLTERGSLLADAASSFIDDFENLKKLCDDIHDVKTGHLTLAATNGLMVYVFPGVIRNFRQEFPQIKLKLVSRSLCSEFLPMLPNGEVDLAIGPKSNRELPRKVEFLFWKSFRRILLLSKDHPLGKKKTIRLADISAHPLILFRTGAETRKVVEDTFAKHKLPYEVTMELDVAENVKEYVQMGAGVSVLPSFTFTRADIQRLRSVDVSHLFGMADYGIYHRNRKKYYFTSAMKQFIKTFSPALYDNFR